MAIILIIPCINQIILSLFTVNPSFVVDFTSQYSTLFEIKMQLDKFPVISYNVRQSLKENAGVNVPFKLLIGTVSQTDLRCMITGSGTRFL